MRERFAEGFFFPTEVGKGLVEHLEVFPLFCTCESEFEEAEVAPGEGKLSKTTVIKDGENDFLKRFRALGAAMI